MEAAENLGVKSVSVARAEGTGKGMTGGATASLARGGHGRRAGAGGWRLTRGPELPAREASYGRECGAGREWERGELARADLLGRAG